MEGREEKRKRIGSLSERKPNVHNKREGFSVKEETELNHNAYQGKGTDADRGVRGMERKQGK